MAVTAIWNIKGSVGTVIRYVRNPEKITEEIFNDLHDVTDVIDYAVQSNKTEERKYVSCLNCFEETAINQFINTKKLMRKEGGIVAFHGIQSFKADEVTPEQAHSIGVELAKRLWGERFEVVVATHLNTGHLHNHFVINSVSFKDGYRYYDNKESYKKMRDVSDRLCIEYGLSVIEENTGVAKSYAEWSAEKTGNLTQRDIIRRDIDNAIKYSVTQKQFILSMEKLGYEFKFRTETGQQLKYPAIKPPGAKGYFRFHKLGGEYSLQKIAERINRNWIVKRPPQKKPTRRYGKLNGNILINNSSIYRLYLRYCYELGIIRKNRTPNKKVYFSLREDVVKMDKYMLQSKVLGKYKINTISELNFRKTEINNNITSLVSVRNGLRKQLKNKQRKEEDVTEIKKQITDITSQLRTLRKEVTALEQIEQRSRQVKENLKELDKQKTKERQEVKKHEHIIGRR